MGRTGLTLIGMRAALLCAIAAQGPGAQPGSLNSWRSKLAAHGELEVCLRQKAADLLPGEPNGMAGCRAHFNAALEKADADAGSLRWGTRYIDNY